MFRFIFNVNARYLAHALISEIYARYLAQCTYKWKVLIDQIIEFLF